LVVVAAIALALAIAGCGGDSSGETTAPAVSIPAITSPIAPTATATAPATTSTPKGATTTTSGHGKRYNPKLPDSATNDVPPPAGSPQANFENQCKQNPQACG
jgi:hypothetical protein